MFDSDLSIQGTATPTVWRVIAPLIWTGREGDTFTVPVGFLTDFATVPRFLHWLILPYGAYTRSAVLHDWMLTELAAWEIRDRQDPPPPANSRDIDGVFRATMKDLGVPWLKRWAMWTGVRWAALFNPVRAYGRGFLADAPKVLAFSALAAPFLLPGVVGVLISLGFARLGTLITGKPPVRRRDRRVGAVPKGLNDG